MEAIGQLPVIDTFGLVLCALTAIPLVGILVNVLRGQPKRPQ
jgi:hypothetical protein